MSEDERQYHISLKKGDVARYVLLPGDPGRVPRIAEYLDEAEKIAENREYRTYTGKYKGIPVSVVSTGIGCPSAAIAIEELIKIGADTFIRVGTAGSLQPDISLGDLVISTGSVREEGTTKQYVPEIYPAVADIEVTSALKQAAVNLGYPHHLGISHCKDAFYSEDMDIPLREEQEIRWKVWQRARVLATSMESAALFVISSIRGVRTGEILAVIGSTHDNQPIIKKAGIGEAVKTALEAVRILDAKNDHADQTLRR